MEFVDYVTDLSKNQASTLTRRNLDEGTNVKVDRSMIMEWVHHAWKSITTEAILNTWRHCQYNLE
jgi:hypothetical protein